MFGLALKNHKHSFPISLNYMAFRGKDCIAKTGLWWQNQTIPTTIVCLTWGSSSKGHRVCPSHKWNFCMRSKILKQVLIFFFTSQDCVAIKNTDCTSQTVPWRAFKSNTPKLIMVPVHCTEHILDTEIIIITRLLGLNYTSMTCAQWIYRKI